MKIYNTLTNKKEKFIPINPNEITMYVCGPTVYNYIHIGNARSIVAFDTIRRYLIYRGYKVNYVSNFTDVDDKIINESNLEKISIPSLTQKYINAFYDDIKFLNVMPATNNPKVSDNISEIINFIKIMIDKDFAYSVDGNVYFKTRKFANYGNLSRQSINDLEADASERLSVYEKNIKFDPLDFALWKKSKNGEIAWESPWGKGRPGWHIECSVMATKYLGDNIDIHGGGQDLEFPHHENEIAQSETVTGKRFVNYWMHNGFVTVGDGNKKMSKSLHNFVTIHELKKNIDPHVLRFFLSTVNYRKPIQYSIKNINKAETNLNKIKNAYFNLQYYLNHNVSDESDENIVEEFNQLKQEFIFNMDDDFNIQNAMVSIYDIVKLMNIYSKNSHISKLSTKYILNEFRNMISVIGISLPKHYDSHILLDQDINKLIQERQKARLNKNYQRSDEIRNLLKQKGILLEDTIQGTRWRKMDD